METNGHRPKMFSSESFGALFGNIPTVTGLIRKEPEILVFAAIQWIAIWLAYIGWTQMLHWIPDELWNAVEAHHSHGDKASFYLINLVLLGWSFIIVCIVSYPIGLCTAAMIAVHDLRASNQESTIPKCLAIADRHLGRIWAFTALDSWITVEAIMDRLPKKHYHRTALDELLYYAWKISTMAIVPALVNGRDFLAAGQDSLKLLMKQPARALSLRLGYSAVCWVIGVLSYVGAIVTFWGFGDRDNAAHFMYNFYLLMGVPIFVSVGVISIVVRPFYLLGLAQFYTSLIDVRPEIEKDIQSIPKWEESLFSWRFMLFLAMSITLAVTIIYADRLGLTGWVTQLAHRDLMAL